jgi:cysteinyl-tRNA synthetase
MIRKIFGTTIDIHTGGVDLIFPHHENEIAQSEAAYGETFVRHWIHAEHLLVNGSKMSKSLGNFYTLRDLLEKGHSPRSIRYLLISAHYRKQYNFTIEGIAQADQALARIDNLLVRLRDVKKDGPADPAVREKADRLLADFTEAVDDDLNISRGLGVFFEFAHDVNTLMNDEKLSRADCDTVLDALGKLDAVLGVIFFEAPARQDIDAAWVESLIAERIAAKKNKNFARADEIRNELLDRGVVLEDTKEGTRWKAKS